MASSTGHTTDHLADTVAELAGNIESLDFISAVRAIECQRGDSPGLGQSVRVADEKLRISQTVSLGFKGTALESLESTAGKHAYRLYCNFFGLLGSNGPLPLHYTEYADRRSRHHQDPTFREFLDLFNHRMLCLFYRACVEFDPAINGDRPAANNFDSFVGAFSGHSLDTACNRDSIPDVAKLYYASWLGGKSKSPDGIESLVGEYFGLTARVHEFTGGWLTLPAESMLALGGLNGNAQLGTSTYIGRRVWSIGHKFKLSVGPLTWVDFRSFKPGSQRAVELRDLVRNYVGDEWDWDIELLVKKGQVDALQLNRQCSLGFDSWLAGSRAANLSEQSVGVNGNVLGRARH